MSELKLRVDGKYRRRDGEEETIVSDNGKQPFVMIAESGKTYRTNGQSIGGSINVPLDLLEEITDDQPAEQYQPTGDCVEHNPHPTIDWTKPLQTRQGNKAELKFVLKNEIRDRRYVVLVTDENGEEDVETYQSDGTFYGNPRSKYPEELINTPPKPRTWKRWCVFIHREDGASHLMEFNTKAEAMQIISKFNCVVAVKRITITEGEGLEGKR